MMIAAGRGPNLTTAEDMGKLLEMLHNNKLGGSKQLLRVMNEVTLRTRIPAKIPNDIKIPHKEGSLKEAVHDVGIVYGENTFIFYFLSDDQKDKEKTHAVLSSLAKECFYYKNKITPQ